ncbi:MAG: rhodanese-like domain-containing protein [Acidithiobacillales bacterium]
MQAGLAESSPAKGQQRRGGSSSKGRTAEQAAAATPRGSGATALDSLPSKKTPGGVPSASSPPASGSAAEATASSADLLSRFPPHPDRPYVEISGEDAARLWAAGVPFLDARRTSAYEEGHVAGARSFSAWESDVDEKVVALVAERDGRQPLVVYCSGGDCEDSHLLAQKLWGAGFNDILVYRDGYPDWVKRGGAVRTGAKR